MQKSSLFASDSDVVQAARAILANELAVIRAHEPALSRDADVFAVHETRKAIRRTFTAMKLFGRYFEPGVLKAYRRPMRDMMRRLGRCRDTAVFLKALSDFSKNGDPLPELDGFWHRRQAEAEADLRRHLSRPKLRNFLDDYARFVNTPELGQLATFDSLTPRKISHIAPVLIYERLGAVRVFEDHLEEASMECLHQLRIQIKELRYTLRFFRPLLGVEIGEALKTLKDLQILLGDLNDARVAMDIIADTPASETALARYKAVKQELIVSLIDKLPPLWAEFNSRRWRSQLAAGIATF